MDSGIIAFPAQCFFQAAAGRRQVARGLLQYADIEVAVCIARPQFEPPFQHADRAGRVAAGLVNLPENVVGWGVLGIDLQQTGEQRGGLRHVAGPKRDFAKMIQRIGVSGLLRQHLSI